MLKVVISLLLSGSAFAAGAEGGHHAGPADLIFPAINLSILIGFIIWKVKKPASDMFKNKSKEVREKIESAAVKAKEAEMMMDMQQKKMSGAEEEIAKLESEANDIVTKFESEYKTEVENRINKMKEDAGQKIEAEKKELLDKLNASLLDQVLTKAKTKLKDDKGLSESAAAKILGGAK